MTNFLADKKKTVILFFFFFLCFNEVKQSKVTQ